jgi:hypothetical protein
VQENEDLLEKIGALGAGAESRAAPKPRESSLEPGGGAGPSGRPATAGGKRKDMSGLPPVAQKKQKTETAAVSLISKLLFFKERLVLGHGG